MYKNLIGLTKLNSRANSKQNMSNKTNKCQPDSISISGDTKSDAGSFLIEDYFGNSNYNQIYTNDNDTDDYHDYYNSSNLNQNNPSLNTNETGSICSKSDNMIVFKQDEEENEDEDDSFDNYNDLNDQDITPVKIGSEVRLDLINEIRDEFMNENDDSILSDTKSDRIPNDLIRAYSYDEDDDEEDKTDDSEEGSGGSNQKESSTLYKNNLNLNDLRIAIDEIEELTDVVESASNNKTCFVFVIKVWHMENDFLTKLRQKSAPSVSLLNDENLSWIVKRKYDEFYVLDTRLKEFHGGLITSAEFNMNNLHKITAQLPPKQRALFFLNDTNNVGFLNSIKNDFSKYLQVIKSSY
jgi:hypothetical protein